MVISDRILMGPGPCNPYPEAQAALGRPLLGHLDPDFIALLDETNDRLRSVFGTGNALTFPVSATGSGGMEAAFVNVLTPWDVVVVGVNGVFGQRMCQVAERIGAEVIRVDFPWGTPVDPERLLAAHRSPSAIAMVHAETSTGVVSPLKEVGDNKGDALFIVDCVTSLGGTRVDVDDNSIDIAYSGTQKCLGVAPGLAPLSVSDRAIARLVDKPQSWYFDLGMIANYVTGSGARAYHHTAPISMIYSLHAGLGAVLDEGLDTAIERHRRCGRLLQDGLEKLGLKLFATEGHRLPQLTSVLVPEERLHDGVSGPKLTEADVRQILLQRYGIEIGGGLGDYAGKIWRIGCMGHTARERNVKLVLTAIEDMLS